MKKTLKISDEDVMKSVELVAKRIDAKYKNSVVIKRIDETLYVDFKPDSVRELSGEETFAVYPDLKNTKWSVVFFKYLNSENFKSTTEFSQNTKTFDIEELLVLFDTCFYKMVKDSSDFWKENDDLLRQMNIMLPFFRRNEHS